MQYAPMAGLLVSMVYPAVEIRGVCLRNCNVMMSVSAERSKLDRLSMIFSNQHRLGDGIGDGK